MKLNIFDSMPTPLGELRAKRKSNPNIPVEGKGLENDKKILMAAMSESQGWKGHCHARHLSSCCKLETEQIQLVHNNKYKKQMKSAEMQILKKASVMQIICQRMEV